MVRQLLSLLLIFNITPIFSKSCTDISKLKQKLCPTFRGGKKPIPCPCKKEIEDCCNAINNNLNKINTNIETLIQNEEECCEETNNNLTTINTSINNQTQQQEECCEETNNNLIAILNAIQKLSPGGGCLEIALRDKDFDPSFTITASGKYLLCEPITYEGSAGTSALTIDANDVLLDMNGFSLTYEAAGANVNGILVNPNKRNINIVNSKKNNGSIRNFTGSGIKADATSGTIQQLTIEDIISNNNGIGINLTKTSISTIKRIKTSANSTGIIIDNATNAEVIESHADNNSGNGISITNNSSNILVSNSTAENNSITAGGLSISGILVQNSNGVLLEKCSTSFTNTTAGSFAAGIHLTGSTCKQNKVIECTSSANTAPAGTSYGIFIDAAVNSKIEANTISHNDFGIRDTASPSTNLYMKNVAFSNSTNYSVTYGNAGNLLVHNVPTSGLSEIINVNQFENIAITDTP